MSVFRTFKNLLFGSIGMIVFGGIALIVIIFLMMTVKEVATPDIIRYIDASEYGRAGYVKVCRDRWDCTPPSESIFNEEHLTCNGSMIRDGIKVEVEDSIPTDHTECVEIAIKGGSHQGDVAYVPYNRLRKER